MTTTAKDGARSGWRIRVELPYLLACVAMALAFQGARLVARADDGGWTLRGDRIVPAGDALQFAERWEAARVALVDFRQFPSWNPYHCGGVALFGDAEAPFPGPLFLLTFFWLQTAWAMNLWMVLHLVAGALGAMLLARDAGANPPEQLLGAAVVAGCSCFAHHFVWEHLSFAPFVLLPWILWAHRRALDDRRFAVAEAALFAVAVYEGGANPVPIMAAAVAVDSLARLGDARERRALAVVLPMVAVLALLLAAPRLVAVWDVLGAKRSPFVGSEGMSVREVLRAWLGHHPPRDWVRAIGWDEFSDHVGALPVTLMLLGAVAAVVARDPVARARRIDLVLLLVFVWLALGDAASPSLYRLLRTLPVYAQLRVPSRFLFPATVALGSLAVTGLGLLRRWAGASVRWPRAAPLFVALEWVLLVAVACDLAAADAIVARESRVPPGSAAAIAPGAASASFFQTSAASDDPVPGHPVDGRGTQACYHPQYGARPAPGLRTGPGEQQWLIPAQAGSLELLRWSPSELRFRLTSARRRAW